MIVFKNYLKVARNYVHIILIFTVIFVSLAAIYTQSEQDNQLDTQLAKVAIINHDKNTPFITNFEQYIKETAILISLDADEKSLKDALFFRQVDYIIIIPENYTSDFMAGKDVQIDVMSVPDAAAAMYSREIMNRYLHLANLYIKAGISEEVFAEKLLEDLTQEPTVNYTSDIFRGELSSARHFYNYANYTFLAITITIVSIIMVSFKDDNIKKRNAISPMSYKKINRQLLLGNIVFTMAIWLLYVGVSFILYTDTMLSMHGLLFVCNSAVFITTVLALAFLVATLSNNKEVLSGASSLISLGTSFIAGAFVPQEFLGGLVIFIAKFTPSYWYITNNNSISGLTAFKMQTLEPIVINIAIMLGFTFLLYVAIQCISKWQLKK